MDTCQWWDKDGDEGLRANALFNHARDIEERHSAQHENNLLYAQLYSNRELPSFDWGLGVRFDSSLSPVSRLSENLAALTVDTLVSQVGKSRTRPVVILKGAPFTMKRRAKMLERAVYAEFLTQDAYGKFTGVFRDAGIFCFGAVRVDVEDDRVCIERLFPDNVLVDQQECLDGQKPLHVFIRKVLPLETVANNFGLDLEQLKLEYSIGKRKYVDYRGVGYDRCVVIEGFRRAFKTASGKMIPGRRVLAIQGTIIADEKWTEEWFPIEFFHWEDPVNGFYCPSEVESILPYQIRLNEINDLIRESQDLMARPRVLEHESARLSVGDLDNAVGRRVRWQGSIEPKALVWPAVSAEIYSERDRTVRSCLEFRGMTQLAAQGKLPANARLDSAAALRELTLVNDDRRAPLAARFEKFQLRVAELVINTINKNKLNIETVWWRGGKSPRAESMTWDDVNIERDRYVLHMDAASTLNMTPAGRRQELDDMLARQEITPEQYQAEYTNPDLEGLASLASAANEDIKSTIELLERGEYQAPNELQDLVNGVPMVHAAMLDLKNNWNDVPQEVMDNFEAWILHGKSILEGVQGVAEAQQAEAEALMQQQAMASQGAMLPGQDVNPTLGTQIEPPNVPVGATPMA